MTNKETVAYLDAVEIQMKKARSIVVESKNALIEALNALNELQASLNAKRIELLTAMRDEATD